MTEATRTLNRAESEVLDLAEDYGQWMWDAGYMDNPAGETLVDDAAFRRQEIRAAFEGALNDAYAEGRKDEREEQETFLRDLLWGEVQKCCGNYEAGYGGEYMGQVEMVPVCCYCPDVERNDDAQILAVLRARVPDPTICQTCHADPIPGHTFCPDCKDEWPA